jgi:enoyl-CoA hydratase/carnithine racemase
MDYKLIQVEKEGHLTKITINRPDVRNAINPPTTIEMQDAIEDFDTDPNAWVAIVTGAGDMAFSAGNDLKYDALTPPEKAQEERSQIKWGMAGLTHNNHLKKPVIAAVNGLAYGGGWEMALGCDIIVASEQAKFRFPEPLVGRVPSGGGVVRLVRRIPYHIAMDVLLSCKILDAQEALHYGAVSRVVPHDDLMKESEKIAEDIMQFSPLGIKTVKEMAIDGLEIPLREANKNQFPLNHQFQQSEDFIEGPRAFTEKRKPNWKGV